MVPMVQVPREVRVYDSGKDFFDRFTVVFPDGALYRMSTNAMSDIGFCQYAGHRDRTPFDSTARLVAEIPLHVAQRIEALLT